MDYSKIVIISKNEYIDSVNAIIDKDEFNETIINLNRIKREALKFVEEYVAHVNKTSELHECEFTRRYTYSPLKYFHRELGISP